MASAAFNSSFGGDWLSQLGGYGAPIDLGNAGLAPITGIPGLGGGPLGGGGDIVGALDRYTAGLGKMQTKDWIGAGIGGVQTLGSLIGAFGSLGLAKKQYGLQKRMMETNLTNSVQAYNTALEDKARSRAVAEGQTDSQRDEYIRSHSATTGR